VDAGFSQLTRPQIKTAYTLGAVTVDIQTMHEDYYFSPSR